MKNYTDSRKKNAVLFMEEQGYSNTLGGKWTNGKLYDHILKIGKGQKKLKIIGKYNLLSGIYPDLFSSPHRFAHHLTSSQVMCYNFFRPLIGKDGALSEELINILENRNILIPHNCTCVFEASNPIDNTSYDMAIGAARFEIKFTEYGFGKAKRDARHESKFDNVYKALIDKCKCLSCIPKIEVFLKYYQLFRNVLHIDNKSKYAVFIFPKRNKQCYKEFQEFISMFIKDEFMENIQVWYWEGLLAGHEDSDFYKKYLR